MIDTHLIIKEPGKERHGENYLRNCKTGSELALETFRDLGIDTIFGYLGGAVLPLYVMLFIVLKGSNIFWPDMNKAACMKLKATPNQLESCVAVVTSGPGANPMPFTGIADAMSDSVPLLIDRPTVPVSGRMPSKC